MLAGTASGCINHPSVEASVRCKMCTKPVCQACVCAGPCGLYCSPVCKEKHEHFLKQAQAMDSRARLGILGLLRKVIGNMIVWVAVLFVIGLIASLVYIPVLSELVYRIRGIIGV